MPNEGEGVAEGWIGFGIPADAFRQYALVTPDPTGPEGDQGEQAEQGWGGARDREIRPLPLDTEVAANLGERDLDPPPADEPAQDLRGFGIEVGAQESLRLPAAFGVPHQHPADQHPSAGVMPQRGAGRGDCRKVGGAVLIRL